jgi:hypothetical protein
LNRLKSFWNQPIKTFKGTAFSSAVTFFLNVLNILKLLSFEGVLHLGGKKCNQESGIVLTSLDEALA